MRVYFSSSFLERIDSVSMDDYTPTDQVCKNNGAGSEPRLTFIWIFCVIYFSPYCSWNRAYGRIAKYGPAVCVMDVKEEEAFWWWKLVFYYCNIWSLIPVIHQFCLLASHSVSHKKSWMVKRTESINIKSYGFPHQPLLQRSNALFQ